MMAHDHNHADGHHDGQRHDHTGHSQGVSADADFGKLAVALALILGFMAAEVIAGILASSLALLSDAAHMLTDAAALALSLIVRSARAAPGEGRHDLRPQTHGDPLSAVQRRNPAGACAVHRPRGIVGWSRRPAWRAQPC